MPQCRKTLHFHGLPVFLTLRCLSSTNILSSSAPSTLRRLPAQRGTPACPETRADSEWIGPFPKPLPGWIIRYGGVLLSLILLLTLAGIKVIVGKLNLRFIFMRGYMSAAFIAHRGASGAMISFYTTYGRVIAGTHRQVHLSRSRERCFFWVADWHLQ